MNFRNIAIGIYSLKVSCLVNIKSNRLKERPVFYIKLVTDIIKNAVKYDCMSLNEYSKKLAKAIRRNLCLAKK